MRKTYALSECNQPFTPPMVIPFVKYLWKKRNTKSTGYTASIAITKWRISDGIMHTSTNRFGSTKCLRYSTSRSFFYSKYCKAYKSGFFYTELSFSGYSISQQRNGMLQMPSSIYSAESFFQHIYIPKHHMSLLHQSVLPEKRNILFIQQ